MKKSFDIAVVGAGPGGYVAAIRSAQLGASVVLIEKRSTLGGTCLNVGCIPSKALLDSSELYHQAKEKFSIHGIGVEKLSLNLKDMMKRKKAVVDTTTAGIDYLIKKNNITRLHAEASFKDLHTLAVNGEEISAKNIILATGSKEAELPFLPFDGHVVLSSTHALELETLPSHLIIIGGGVIGVEMGSIYARLGSKVTIIEYMDRLIPTMDKELGISLQKSLKKLGIDFLLKTKVIKSELTKQGAKLFIQQDASDSFIEGSHVLVCIGRKPYLEGLNLDKIGLQSTGLIEVNSQFQTKIPHIYAIGDIIKGPMLAHKASEEGSACAEYIAGKKPHYNPLTIPGVVYTWPEVACVGKTEEELNQLQIPFKKGVAPFKASGRARAAEESDGFIKILASKETDEILGVHMIGPRCADLINECVVALEYRASAEDIAMMSHAHPTFSESIKEAALAATANRAIHF